MKDWRWRKDAQGNNHYVTMEKRGWFKKKTVMTYTVTKPLTFENIYPDEHGGMPDQHLFKLKAELPNTKR